MYGIKQNRDRTAIAQMVSEVDVAVFEPRSGVRIDVNDAEAQARGNDGSAGGCPKTITFYVFFAFYCKTINYWRRFIWRITKMRQN